MKHFLQKYFLRLIFPVILVSLGFTSGAQVDISGKIIDDEGLPLPGVTIVVKGTTIGTISDFEGQYSLSVPDLTAEMQYSFIGYETHTEFLNGRKRLDITMRTTLKDIDEVVVIGYGTMKKSDLSGSSVTVTSKDMQSAVNANIDQVLQGKVAGVSMVSISGQPGSSVNVNIRGQGTLSQASQPLYVIDGVPVQNTSQSGHAVGIGDNLGNGSSGTFSGLSSINPADIESVEVLKDASATAIYGSRAANGVIIITTKGGRKGATQFNYSALYGSQQQVRKIDVLNLRDYAKYSNDYASESDGRDPRIEYLDPSILGDGTDWQGAVFQTAPMQTHQLSAAGGTEKLKFFVSGSYYNQDGTVIGSTFNRFTTRVNLDAELKKWLRMGTQISMANFNDRLGLTNSQDGIISVALLSSPDIPIYNTDGSWAGDEREGSPGRINPIAKALDEENLLKRNNIRANYWTELGIIPELKLRSEVATDITYTNAYVFEPTYQYGKLIKSSNSAGRQFNQSTYWELKNYLTYSKVINNHSITAMAGQETSEWSWEFIRGSATGLSSNDLHEPGLGEPDTYLVGSGKGSGARVSFFGRAYYGFSNKYNITYTYRQDGSSNFGDQNRWAAFHAFSASWRINNESFMQFAKSVVSDLKIRAGWGQVGNDNIGGYRWGAGIGTMPTGLGQGYRQTNIANPYVTWEKQESWNIGLDLGLFNNRITFVGEYYIKTSNDMLMDMQLPSYMGTSGNVSTRLNAPVGNFGEIQNKGFEFSLNAFPFNKKFVWEIGMQVSANRNKLIALQGIEASGIEGHGQWFDVVALSEIGQPLYSFYGYQVAGVYQNKEDLLNSPKPKEYPTDGNFIRNGLWVGDLKYADLSGPAGVPDGVIDEFDKTFIGSPLPKFTFGLSNNFRYKNIELSVFITGSYGNKLLNYIGRDLSNMSNMWDNQLAIVNDRTKLEPIDPSIVYPFTNSYGTVINSWYNDIDNIQVSNPGADLPRAISNDPANNTRISDRYVEDGSYLRFKAINLAYTIDNSSLKRVGISNLKVYINLQNMWTLTKYSGFDPEVGASQTSDFVMGLDNGRYPAPRIYSVGLNLTF